MDDSTPFYPPSGASLFEILARSQRKPGTKRDGGDFSRDEKSAVWWKGFKVANNDANVFLKDRYSSWMQWSKYGDRDSEYGWEIDHIIPVARGGTDDLSNLQPLNWKNNVQKGLGGHPKSGHQWTPQNRPPRKRPGRVHSGVD